MKLLVYVYISMELEKNLYVYINAIFGAILLNFRLSHNDYE